MQMELETEAAERGEELATTPHESTSDLVEGTQSFQMLPENVLLQDNLNSKKNCLTEHELMAKLQPCVNYELKAKDILQVLQKDLDVLDLKISMYIAACNAGHLKPFPEHIVEASFEGLQCLLLLNSQIPPLALLRKNLEEDSDDINKHVISVIHWLLRLPGPRYVDVRPQEFPEILQKVESFQPYEILPNYIFRAMVNKTSPNHLQWMATKEKLMAGKSELETKFAFYCGEVEQLHSLTSVGLYPFQKINGPKGFGVYLTNNLKSCLDNSSPKWVWGKSVFGVELQTAIIVEFIVNHPDVICYTDADTGNESAESQENKYYCVTDTHLIQLRYLLIYAKTPSKLKPEKILSAKHSSIGSIFTFNRAFVLAGYILASYLILTSYKFNPKYKGLTSLLTSIKSIKPFN
ncbi:uncharacterized protein LOC106669015 [Cimex lectularius]|uniref:PARP16 N-terminal domain-containing protein n=1 Tax=Cimex lectularius TaxID=79782 RepID=A0A8I6S5K5_CIMLE|nr:uncharacterized protein LOC106669015 [Cimex lectularius]